MLAEALVNPAGEDLGRALVIRLEEILAHRVVSVAVPHEDALQLGMPGEMHAHHVVDFALLEVGTAPDLVERRHDAPALGLVGADPQLDQLPLIDRAVKLVVDLDAVLVVDALQARQVVVLDRVLVAEVERDLDELVGLDQ